MEDTGSNKIHTTCKQEGGLFMGKKETRKREVGGGVSECSERESSENKI